MRAMKHRLGLQLVALGISVAASAQIADIKVIANSSVRTSEISAEEIRGVFLATKGSLSDGSRVEPVLLKGGPSHETFLRLYLGKTDSALETYYRSRVFAGKGLMPIALPSEAAMVAFVAKTKGAVGYVSTTTNATGVKTLGVR